MPTSLLSRLEHLMPIPKFDYTWQIHLDSKTLFFTYKNGEPRNIYHFPLSYKKNDFGIRMLEKIIHKTVAPDKLYFDIGANFGLRSLYYLSHGRKSLLFEPNEICNTITKRLIAENNLSNATVISKAVGHSAGEIKFHRSVSTYLSSVHAEYPAACNDYFDTITKEMVSVDDYISVNKLKGKVGIVKIDVEGYESEVCTGAEQLFRDDTVAAIIEITSSAERKAAIFSSFNKWGYKIYAVKPSTSKLYLVECVDKFSEPYFDFLCTNNEVLIKNLKRYIHKS